MNTRVSSRAVGLIGWAIAVSTASAQPCAPSWSDQFSLGGFDSWIWDVVVHDDGNGPAVYAAGNFTRAGNASISYLARLDGSEWQPVGEPFNEMVLSLASCADWPGLGPQLFAGGWFRQVGATDVNSIARWGGSSWVPLGAGVTIQGQPYSWVMSMLYVADAFGDGPALFAGGAFDTAGVLPASNIARWNGTSWSPLGKGLNGTVDALAWFDDGNGPALYAAGYFVIAPGKYLDIARWDGATWTPLPTGLDLSATTMAVHDDGNGPALFVGGSAPDDDGSLALGAVARWDGIAWTQVGETFTGALNGAVVEISTFDVGNGPVLVTSGSFDHVGGVHIEHIAAWDGVAWSPLDGGLDASAYGIVSIPGEAAMYAGGFFHDAGGVGERFARWDGAAWSAVGNGAAGDPVWALEVFDDGSGPGLYIGGDFSSAGGTSAASIVRWDGAHGTPVGGGVDGGGVNDAVLAMEAVTDLPFGPGLYVGGQFQHAGRTPAASIARWDGTTWTALGDGVNGVVRALQVYDDGTGPALYVGGDFSLAGGVGVDNIARWDGQQWAAVARGLPGELGVRALAVFDDGNGPALFAGGYFGQYPYSTPEGLARLDGDQWVPVGDGITGNVYVMKVFDDGSGPGLFIGGSYCVLPQDDAQPCYLARWDGSAWSGFPPLGGTVYALEFYDDGTGHGPRLYAGGYFAAAFSHIAVLDGTTWSPLASGVGEPYGSYVLAMAVFDDGLGDGDALYVGGGFDTAGDLLSSNIARWGGCGNFVLGDLTGDGVVGIDDFDALLAAWGPCPDCAACPADLDGDCVVGIRDFLILLAHWS